MAIVDDLKGRMNEALRAKNEVAKNIYRLAYSELQLASARYQHSRMHHHIGY